MMALKQIILKEKEKRIGWASVDIEAEQSNWGKLQMELNWKLFFFITKSEIPNCACIFPSLMTEIEARLSAGPLNPDMQ